VESLIRKKDAVGRFAVGEAKFNAEIRPHLTEVPLGPRAIAFTASSIEKQLAVMIANRDNPPPKAPVPKGPKRHAADLKGDVMPGQQKSEVLPNEDH
jgi:hypothetical protein